MKKKKSAAKALPLALAALLALLLLCGFSTAAQAAAAGAKTAPPTAPDPDIEALIEDGEIVESRHNREPDYMAAFQTHKLSVGPFSLHMENRIYEEAQLRGKARALWRDLCALEEAVGEKPGIVTVYLVERTVEGRPQAVGAQIFCTPEDLESGAYREALIGAAYSLSCPWQQAGLAELVFGRESNLSLRAYYGDEAHALTASCSAIHLSPILSDEETVLAARATARSLTAYLLENGGFAAFQAAEDPGAVLPAWAESLGISPAPQLPEGSAQAATLTLGSRAGWICALEVQNFTVLLTEDSWLLDPDGLYAWFCSFFTGMDLVLEQIGQEAPSALALARERYAEPITISFLSMEQPTYAFPTRNQIDLTKANAVWHEMVHLLLREKRLRSGQNWQEEALAEHFSYRAQTRFAPTRYYSEGYEAYLTFFEEESGKEPAEDDLRFHESVWTLYQSFRDPQRTESDDNEAYCRAYGICSLVLEGQLERTQVRKKYDLSVNAKRELQCGGKDSDGEALSYPESLVLFEYLAERFGMDAAVEAFLNGLSPEEAFGIPYPELYAEARAEYERRYLDRMALD